MIITISGKAGSGKSTVATLLAKKLHIKHYSIGDLMRQMAKEKQVSLLELSKEAEQDNSIDKELDDRQIHLGKSEDNFVIDGRLTAFFIPNATFKIFLDCDDNTRTKRILDEKREGETSKNIHEMMKKINQREESERKRYKEYYNYDYQDTANYQFVIDTTNLTISQMLEEVLKVISSVQ